MLGRLAFATIGIYSLIPSLSFCGVSSASASRLQGAVRAPWKVHLVNKKLVITLDARLQQAITQHFSGQRLPLQENAEKLNYYASHVSEFAAVGETAEQQVEFICTGDFDGNGLLDVALYLVKKGPPYRRPGWKVARRRYLLVAFHQTAPGVFRPYTVARRWNPGFSFDDNADELESLRERGIKRKSRGAKVTYVLPNSGRMRLKHDGISEWSFDGEVEDVLFFRNGRYHDVNAVEDDD